MMKVMISNPSSNNHLEVVNYRYETWNTDDETKDNDGCTPISNNSRNYHIEVIKYHINKSTLY